MNQTSVLYKTVLGFNEPQSIDFPSWMENATFVFDNTVHPCYQLSFNVSHTECTKFYVNVFIRLNSNVVFETLFTEFGQHSRMITSSNDLETLLDGLYGSPVLALRTATRRARLAYSM
jgi:hypothetical protein